MRRIHRHSRFEAAAATCSHALPVVLFACIAAVGCGSSDERRVELRDMGVSVLVPKNIPDTDVTQFDNSASIRIVSTSAGAGKCKVRVFPDTIETTFAEGVAMIESASWSKLEKWFDRKELPNGWMADYAATVEGKHERTVWYVMHGHECQASLSPSNEECAKAAHRICRSLTELPARTKAD